MVRSPVDDLARRLFGDEGAVVLDDELQLITVATALGVSGVFVVSPILSDLTGVFDVEPTHIGLLMTLFTGPSIVLIPIVGVLADRLGRRPVMVGGLLVYGVAGAGVGLVDTFEAALALRVVQGVGYATVIPLTVTLLGDIYAGSREVTAQGIRLASIQTASLVLPPLAGVLVLVTWRLPFLLFAGSLLVAAWTWVALPDVTPTSDADLRAYLRDLWALLRRPVMALVVASFVLRFLLVFGFYTYISIHLVDLVDASSVTSGLVIALFGLVSVVVSTQAGRITTGRDPLLVLFVGLVLTGIGVAFVGLAPSFAAVLGAVAVFAVGASLTGPVQKSLVNARAPDELRAGAVSGATIAQSVGQTAGPVLFGALVAVGTAADAFLVVGVAGAVLGAVVAGAALRYDGST